MATRQQGNTNLLRDGSWEVDLVEGVRAIATPSGAELAVDCELSDARRRELQEGPLRALNCLVSGGAALHGSAVGIDGLGIAFLGFTGQGKSTLTSEFVRRGASLVSDGLVCVDANGLLQIGQQRIKMREPGMRIHGFEPEAHEPVHELSDKRVIYPDATTNGHSPPLQLKYAFILEVGTEAELKPLRPSERIKLLVLHSYLVRALPTSLQAMILDRAATLAQRCDVVRLVRSDRTEELPDLFQLVRTHLRSRRSGQDLDFNA
ncbi:MAG: hypothetical protein QM784_15025 [Polyangiaceae bacterium]